MQLYVRLENWFHMPEISCRDVLGLRRHRARLAWVDLQQGFEKSGFSPNRANTRKKRIGPFFRQNKWFSLCLQYFLATKWGGFRVIRYKGTWLPKQPQQTGLYFASHFHIISRMISSHTVRDLRTASPVSHKQEYVWRRDTKSCVDREKDFECHNKASSTQSAYSWAEYNRCTLMLSDAPACENVRYVLIPFRFILVLVRGYKFGELRGSAIPNSPRWQPVLDSV